MDSKGQGFHRIMEQTGFRLCPLVAIREIIRANKETWDQLLEKNQSIPLHSLGSGKSLKRGDVCRVLTRVAVESRLADIKVSPHSLRAGGATALFMNGVDRETVMQLGRWRSDAFLRYVNKSLGTQQGVTAAMLQKSVNLIQ